MALGGPGALFLSYPPVTYPLLALPYPRPPESKLESDGACFIRRVDIREDISISTSITIRIAPCIFSTHQALHY